MTTKQLHIIVEQSLQQLGNFAYSDLEPGQMDLVINYTINMMIRAILTPVERSKTNPFVLKGGFEDSQLKLDDLKPLKIDNITLAVTPTLGGVTATLPPDYNTLINDRSTVKKPDCDPDVFPNRLIDSENLYVYLGTELGKTVPESPVSKLSQARIDVYTKGFDILNVIIDYYKNPAVVNYNVPANGAGVIEFNESFCYKIAEKSVITASIWTEQPQLKTQFLEQQASAHD
jgi:hypothetical protein